MKTENEHSSHIANLVLPAQDASFANCGDPIDADDHSSPSRASARCASRSEGKLAIYRCIYCAYIGRPRILSDTTWLLSARPDVSSPPTRLTTSTRAKASETMLLSYKSWKSRRRSASVLASRRSRSNTAVAKIDHIVNRPHSTAGRYVCSLGWSGMLL